MSNGLLVLFPLVVDAGIDFGQPGLPVQHFAAVPLVCGLGGAGLVDQPAGLLDLGLCFGPVVAVLQKAVLEGFELALRLAKGFQGLGDLLDLPVDPLDGAQHPPLRFLRVRLPLEVAVQPKELGHQPFELGRPQVGDLGRPLGAENGLEKQVRRPEQASDGGREVGDLALDRRSAVFPQVALGPAGLRIDLDQGPVIVAAEAETQLLLAVPQIDVVFQSRGRPADHLGERLELLQDGGFAGAVAAGQSDEPGQAGQVQLDLVYAEAVADALESSEANALQFHISPP